MNEEETHGVSQGMEVTALDGQQMRADLEQLDVALQHTQRLASIGVLTASVVHELTNPISIITATCNNLLSQVADDDLTTDELLRYVQMIDQSAWRCARLVQSLRTYTHMDGPETRSCDLNRIIDDSLTLVAYQFRSRYKIEFERELGSDLKPLICDPNQITQVLINLLTNARDALGEGGGTIRVASWALPEEQSVAFSVRDSGPGIAPELLDEIFEPFFTTKPAGEGSGLGLSITRRIVEQHGGRLTADNDATGGAIFTVILPQEV